MADRNFFAELKRRNVYKVAVAYAVVGWLLIQIATQVFPFFDIPNWAVRLAVLLVVLGFPIALVIAWAFEVTPQGIQRTEHTETRPQQSRSRTWIYVVFIGAVLSLALFFLGRFTAKSGAANGSNITDKSIAVLPFANQSGDPAQEYFSDGLSEELINGLGQIHELRVIGRNSSFHFKGKSDDSRALGQALGVANLLEGSVRKAGDRVRISVDLVNAADGSQRWSQTYDRELKDIFAVQEEIAKSVADQLRVTLLGGEVVATGRPSNGNVEAYNAYLQGAYYVWSSNLEGLTKSVAFFEAAIRLDPRYAEAYALKSLAWSQIGYLRGVRGLDEFEQARVAAKAALAITPKLPRAHSMLAYVHINADWDLAAAEAELMRANDNTPNVTHVLAIVRACQGRKEEAIQLEKQAIAADPVNSLFLFSLGSALLDAERYDEAESVLRKAVELRPEASGVHLLLVQAGLCRHEADLALRESESEPPGTLHDVAIALVQTASGDSLKADAALRALIEAHGEEIPFRIAGVYAHRKEPDKVFEWLERAYTLHDPRLIRLRADLFLRAYETDARFAALCKKIRLPVPK
ncbi:MAG: tetratricopeptide repeat protein [Chthoniobacterales bacterium]